MQNKPVNAVNIAIAYNEYLLVDTELVKLVYLQGSFDLISQRLSQRENHFMSGKLLQSQFDALEEPVDAIKVDISGLTAEIVAEILQQLRKDKKPQIDADKRG
ncbi:hypothetical protein [Brunnivagina elsteri]|uniref:hypothetical protein n=1 Tax=Brunnivagina elsteri TaxID=1247191 RepID=UPI0031832424